MARKRRGVAIRFVRRGFLVPNIGIYPPLGGVLFKSHPVFFISRKEFHRAPTLGGLCASADVVGYDLSRTPNSGKMRSYIAVLSHLPYLYRRREWRKRGFYWGFGRCRFWMLSISRFLWRFFGGCIWRVAHRWVDYIPLQRWKRIWPSGDFASPSGIPF